MLQFLILLDDSKTSKTDFQKHHSFSLASNSAVSINGFKKSFSSNEIKEPESKQQSSLLEKVEFTEIAQGSNKSNYY